MSIDILVATALLWIGANTIYTNPKPAAAVEFVEVITNSEAPAGAGHIIAGQYVIKEQKILMLTGSDMTGRHSMSILIHELIHHQQFLRMKNDTKKPGYQRWSIIYLSKDCQIKEIEREAYTYQIEYLRQMEVEDKPKFFGKNKEQKKVTMAIDSIDKRLKSDEFDCE